MCRKSMEGFDKRINDLSGWKKVWCDWKAGIKQKIATNKLEARATGGGPFNQLYISKKDEAIGQLCGLYTIVEGIENAHSFGTTKSASSSSDEEETLVDQSMPKTNRSQTLRETPSTSKWTSSKYQDNLKDHLKDYIGSDLQNGKQLSNSVKVLSDICKKNSEKLEVIVGNIRRVYKSVENLTNSLIQELKRHHEELEKAAIEKNQLKKDDIEIKRKKLELEELKNNF